MKLFKTILITTLATLLIVVGFSKVYYEVRLYQFCLNDENRKDEITEDCRQEIREWEFQNGKIIAF